MHVTGIRLVLALLLLLFVNLSTATAAPACRSVFYTNEIVDQFVLPDPPRQWLEWEQKSNFSMFRKPSAPLQVPVVKVNPLSVFTFFLESAPKILRDLIETAQGIRWFRHPFNENINLPNLNIPTQERMVAYQTASRSLAVFLGEYIFTLKLPTDHPHGPDGQFQPTKATVKEDILDGMNRMAYMERVDSEIGLDPDLIIAKEVAMVGDRSTGEGYLFRDLSFMNDGNYYLPALSIPYAGRKIAEINKQSVEEFWRVHYAEVLGRAKAKLLLRYGLQMETPNSQNMLIQLDRDLKPTGKIVFRDVSDTVLVIGVAEGLGEAAVLEKDARLGVENSKVLRPYYSNSVWRFDEAGTQSIDGRVLNNEWREAHDSAYRREIENALGIDLSRIKSLDDNFEFEVLMNQPATKERLRQYREQMKQNKLNYGFLVMEVAKSA